MAPLAKIVLALFVVGFLGGQITAFVPFPGVRITILDCSVFLVLLYCAFRQKNRYIPNLWAPILMFFGWSMVSLLLNAGDAPYFVLGGGLMYAIRWLLYGLLYWAAASRVISYQIWIRTLLLSGIGMAIAGLVQYVLYPDLRNLYYLGWDPHYLRLFSTLLDPNFAGIILGMTLLVLIGIFNMKYRSFWIHLGIGLTLVSLFLTYSRSSILAFFVGLSVWSMFHRKKLIPGIFVVLVAIGLVLSPSGWEGQNMLRTVSSYARVGSGEFAIDLIAQKPLLGHGFKARSGIDSSLLFVAATSGIVGLLVYVWLIWSMIKRASGKMRSARHKGAAFLYISCLILALVHSLFVNSLLYPWVMSWIWIATGALEQKFRVDT